MGLGRRWVYFQPACSSEVSQKKSYHILFLAGQELLKVGFALVVKETINSGKIDCDLPLENNQVIGQEQN